MNLLSKLFNSPLKILLLLIITWIIFANLYFGLTLTYTALPLFLLAILIFIATRLIKKPRLKNKLKKITTSKPFYLAIITLILAIGLTARLSFLQFDYQPRWDPGTFYWNAKSLSETGQLSSKIEPDTNISHQTYFATYPYEMNYTGLLALSNLIFGSGLPSVIILNTILDLLGAALTFLVIKKLLPNQKWPPLTAAALYFLNPFNIVFSALSLPIIAVNTIIMLIIYLIIKYLANQPKNYKTPQLLTLFITLGILTGLGNGFRPIFTIILIAILLLLVYLVASKTIRGKKPIIKTTIAALLMLISYFAITQINFAVVDHYAKIPAARNASGWSLYVGSNPETFGKWGSKSDLAIRNELWQKHQHPQDVHNALTQLAQERYRSNGILGNLNLYLNKALISAGDQKNSMYNASTLIGYPESAKPVIDELAQIFILALSLFLIINLLKNWGKGSRPTWIFLSLIIIGFFAGSLLVEVKNRYFTIFLPILILLSTYTPPPKKRHHPIASSLSSAIPYKSSDPSSTPHPS